MRVFLQTFALTIRLVHLLIIVQFMEHLRVNFERFVLPCDKAIADNDDISEGVSGCPSLKFRRRNSHVI